jgi:hypothetical protein
MREILPEVQSILDSEDALLLDKGYIGIQHQFLENVVYVKHRKPPNRPLEEELKEENRQMETIRRHIEPRFGDVKLRFAITSKKFRHDRKFHELIVHFCIGICNEIHRYLKSPSTYSSIWEGPVPQLSKRKRGSKKVHVRSYLFHLLIITMKI